jgi:Flp pilus assembly protein TadD
MTQQRGIVQRVLIILSGVAFLGGTAVMGISMMTAERPPANSASPSSTETDAETAAKTQLEAQESGYAAVVEREPENQLALEGLVQTRIELGKLEESLAPLETLHNLNPENPQYLQAIAAIHLQTQNFAAALPYLETLHELNPDDAELKSTLDQVKTFVETGELPASESPDPAPEPNATPNDE